MRFYLESGSALPPAQRVVMDTHESRSSPTRQLRQPHLPEGIRTARQCAYGLCTLGVVAAPALMLGAPIAVGAAVESGAVGYVATVARNYLPDTIRAPSPFWRWRIS